MLWNAKNETVVFPDGEMDCIRFGTGEKSLVMLPGLGDGLRTTKGTALPMAAMYRRFSKDFTVWAFSRKTPVPAGYTTRDMARDLKEAMDYLSIPKAHLLGVSMGGMISQHFAADYPEKVDRLVLVVTAARPNPVLESCVREWMEQARQDDHPALMDSNLRLIYSDSYYQKNKKAVPVIARLTKPDSYDRFLHQAQACLTHDAFHRLNTITAPTLVLGGEQDRVLGGDASREIADRIPGAVLKMYPQWGHGLYEEAEDFQQVVMEFLKD